MGRGPTVEGRKNAEDAKRAKVFTKLIREITVATRAGMTDPAANPRLRAAVEKALSANMTPSIVRSSAVPAPMAVPTCRSCATRVTARLALR